MSKKFTELLLIRIAKMRPFHLKHEESFECAHKNSIILYDDHLVICSNSRKSFKNIQLCTER
jgi:hypothetical protein